MGSITETKRYDYRTTTKAYKADKSVYKAEEITPETINGPGKLKKGNIKLMRGVIETDGGMFCPK